MKIYVTGIGITTAIGLTADENLKNLIQGNTGIKQSASYNFMLGSIDLTNEDLLERLEIVDDDFSRTTLLSLLAAKEAFHGNTIDKHIKTGFISATSVGGMDKTETYYFDNKKNQDHRHFPKMTHDNGGTTDAVAAVLGISGLVDTISTACSSGINSIMYGARLIQAGKLDRVLVGGCDPLAHFDIMGFDSLSVFDNNLCQPFDDSRNGLNLGEGAAFLVIESEKSMSLSGNTPLCEVTGWSNTTDAFHQTASSENGFGASLAMKKAIEKAGLLPTDISYINTHGTGTKNNDLSESNAMLEVFGQNVPPFSSTKGYTGHTLAAAGAVEAVFSVQAICNQLLFPNINFETPMLETGLVPIITCQENAQINHALTNSFGFGGNCSSLILSKLN
ncbi:MAG: 3-oxoacyl-(acyl-carrier-protein) synthase [bacterium]|jgi:3-oxoacyl-(acyl-carrier-protein) synthase